MQQTRIVWAQISLKVSPHKLAHPDTRAEEKTTNDVIVGPEIYHGPYLISFKPRVRLSCLCVAGRPSTKNRIPLVTWIIFSPEIIKIEYLFSFLNNNNKKKFTYFRLPNQRDGPRVSIVVFQLLYHFSFFFLIKFKVFK